MIAAPGKGAGMNRHRNVDSATVDGFGREWAAFDQRDARSEDLAAQFAAYFRIFPWERICRDATGADIGCGSGRWARMVAPRVGRLLCVDASDRALAVARSNLEDLANCEFHHATIDALPCADGSLDFAYALGVLHHVPDPAAALRSVCEKLRQGAPLLIYMYYAFDNRPGWYRLLWRGSDALRVVISRLPFRVRYFVSQGLALGVYWPLARVARLCERAGFDVSDFPLAAYRKASVYCMRNDALDRFGTRLEHRFTREEIRTMMESAGLGNVAFSDAPPYWCAIGFRAA